MSSLEKEFHKETKVIRQSLLEAQYLWESAPRSSLFRAGVKVTHLEKKSMDVLESEEHMIGTA